jgi:hypothetical protein
MADAVIVMALVSRVVANQTELSREEAGDFVYGMKGTNGRTAACSSGGQAAVNSIEAATFNGRRVEADRFTSARCRPFRFCAFREVCLSEATSDNSTC